MPKAIDLAGVRYGRLVGVRRVENNVHGHSRWLFRCDCGKEVVRDPASVRYGTTLSCGCLRVENTRAQRRKHGLSHSPTEGAYLGAKRRCTKTNDPKFPQYGGRGISMCERWMAGFEFFLEDMGVRPDGMTLDRIDVNGPYSPSNCRWATVHTQARNRTDNVWVVHEGERMILKDFALLMGVNYRTLCTRIQKCGLTPHEALAPRR